MGRLVRSCLLILLPSAALAAQGVPVYTSSSPHPTTGGTCSGTRVQIHPTSGQPMCCVSSHWAQCGGAGLDSQNATTVVASGSVTPRALADRFADVVNVRDFGAKGDGVTDDTAAIASARSIATTRGIALYFPSGVYKNTSAPTGYVIGPIFYPGRLKVTRRAWGRFDDASGASIIVGGDSEPSTQILGAADTTELAQYGGIDTAALYLQNIAQPPILTTSNTTFTTTSVASVDFASIASSIVVGMVLLTNESPAHFGIISAVSGNTYSVPSWRVSGTGAQSTPANGSTLYVSPATRVWGDNIVVSVPSDGFASSAIASELMLNLYKSGTGAGSQVLKLINNNLIGEQADSAIDVLGLYNYGAHIHQGAVYGIVVENAGNASGGAAFYSLQDASYLATTIAFRSAKTGGGAYGALQAFQAEGAYNAFRAQDPVSRAFTVYKTGTGEVLSIDPDGNVNARHLLSTTRVVGHKVTVAATNGGTATCDANANACLITVGAGVSSFTLGALSNNPSDGQRYTFIVRNSSGGTPTISLDSSLKLGSFTAPATGNQKTVECIYDTAVSQCILTSAAGSVTQ